MHPKAIVPKCTLLDPVQYSLYRLFKRELCEGGSSSQFQRGAAQTPGECRRSPKPYTFMSQKLGSGGKQIPERNKGNMRVVPGPQRRFRALNWI